MSVINRAKEIYREDGVITLLNRIAPYLKYQLLIPIHDAYMELFHIILPNKRNAILNEVEVPSSIERPRLYFDEYIPMYTIPDNPLKENAIVKAHKEYTSPEDKVVIIAGGMGVSTVWAAREASKGELEVFEGGSEQAEAVRDVVQLHELEDRVSIHHAIVGEEIDVYGAGETSTANIIAYEDIPDCDVLELDCEGSELGIIRNMQITPKLLIVELHPLKAGETLTAILDAINEAGFGIERRYTNAGIEIKHEELINILSRRESGGVLPPVVVARKKTS